LERIAMSTQAEFAIILKMNPLFADLGTDELQRISDLCHTRQLAAGEMLFQKGDSGDALFGVRRGQLRIETGTSDGSRLTLNFVGPGDLLGEVAMLDGQRRTAGATAGEETELFVLRREDFLAHLEREPGVAVKLITLLCQRIRWMSERMEESVQQPLPVRLARRLCALESDSGSEVHI
jgi:CRP/FNR family cyclic AMP-dependent transcriptional regulator